MDLQEPETRIPLRRPLRVLIVEDSPADAQLMVAVLKRAGYALSFDAVDSPVLFRKRLEEAEYDIILSGHNLRHWTGMDALEIVSQVAKYIPFVVVTATLGDEAAVEYIKRGAADYILKNRLTRLPVAVGQALREKAHRVEATRLQDQILGAKREWELTFDSVPDPVLLLSPDGRILRANRATAEMIGCEFRQLIGQAYEGALGAPSNPSLTLPPRRMLETGREERADMEVPRLGKTFDAIGTPLRDSTGAMQGCILVMRDITDQKRAADALRESEERYRLLFDANPQPMWVYDLETLAFLAVNEAAIQHYGYTREEFLAMTLKDIRPAEDLPRLLDDVSHVDAGASQAGTWRHRKKGGSLIDVEVAAHDLIFAGKRTRLVLVKDVTERKRLEEQLRQAQKMEAVGRLAGGVAHDFNNLLTIITGYSQLLLDRLSSNDPLRSSAGEIRNAADRAATLTRQLLAFSRQQVLAPQVLDLNAVIANLEKMLRRLIGEDIDLITVPGKDLGKVRADPGQIEQVIMNLAVNARDAMPQGGKLTIETANVELDEAYVGKHVNVSPGSYVMLAVSDTGCGMSADTKSRIFEPFFTTKEMGKGTGLGLATVYGIVRQSGGDIWVYSEPGRGSSFKIYFPGVAPYGQAAPPAEPGFAQLAQGSETVLVVEDEDALRALVRGVLVKSGYMVLDAARGDEALSICQRHPGPIHLLLTDVVMPQMGGRALAELLTPRYPRMKVLYMSGYTDNAIVHHGALDAHIAFLQKPFTPDLLARKVREVLDK